MGRLSAVRKPTHSQVLDHALPAEIPVLRPETGRERRQVVEWIRQGRSEGVFRDGPTPTVATLLDFRRSLTRRGWSYASRIIQSAGGENLGYVDWRARGGAAEILGLFLVSDRRRSGLGRWVVRRVCAELAAEGRKSVTGLVYASNGASLRACRAAGFGEEHVLCRRERGKAMIRLRRTLGRPRRLRRRFSAYDLLRGPNLFLDHLAAADSLSARLSLLDGVQAVLGLGSLGRGFADEHSDLDLAVLGDAATFEGLWRGETWMSGIDIDLFGVDLGASPPESWDTARRQAFGEGVALFVRSPAILRTLSTAVSMNRGEQSGRIQEALLKLGWLGYGPSRWQGRSMKGYLWSLPPDLWDRRGSFACAHVTIDQGLDASLQLLFLLNGELPPDPKWRRFLAEGLDWTPRRLARCIAEVETAPRTRSGIAARRSALLGIVDALAEHAERTGHLSGDIYRNYLERSPDYDPGA